jgi:dipeptidyl aminopeptidase/acylaminoacyl peptidase
MGLALSCCAQPAPARGQGSKADYDRALSLGRRIEGKVFRDRVRPQWLAGNTRFWYRVETGPEACEYVLVDAERGTRQLAFDHTRLAAALGERLGREVRADRLALERLDFPAGGGGFTFTASGRQWRCDLPDYVLRDEAGAVVAAATVPARLEVRPSRRTGAETQITFRNRTPAEVQTYWVDAGGERHKYAAVAAGAEHRQHTFAGHVWLVTDSAGKTLAVFEATEDGGDAVIDGQAKPEAPRPQRPRRTRPEATSPDGKWRLSIRDHNVWVQAAAGGEERALSQDGTAEDGYTDRIHWSPDSTRAVVVQVRAAAERQVHWIESSPKDQVEPRLHSFGYAKPGDSVAVARPRLFDVAAGSIVPVAEALFTNAWEIGDIHWWPDSSRFSFLYNQRGHQVLRVVAVDARSGDAKAVVEERSGTFIDYAGKLFCEHLDATRELVWMSERDGWNHLYLYDAETGRVKNALTRGEWVVRGVERVDAAARQVWFRAGGIRPGQDPYYVHLCRVNFDGTGLTVLTEADGTHEVEFSPDRRFLIDRWSRVDLAPVTELRAADTGRLRCELERADWSALRAAGWAPPERFVAKGRDGATDIYGILIRPAQCEPGRKYPVIEEIYAGPQGAFVPKTFGLGVRPHAIAELGFVVVQIDGMGTSFRSKAFHDVCWKNLGDSGFPDRIAWLKAAAAAHPELDLTQVGIYGGSAGGQSSTRAVLAHGDLYKVAVSDCGCHDNRMDKIWWNELWMGWPVGPHYAEQSNVTLAHRLEGKLMLTVGELDRNVDPASTMQVVNALIRANKDFDLLVVPGAGHGVGETPYASRRRMDFFVRHLLHVEPRHDP